MKHPTQHPIMFAALTNILCAYSDEAINLTFSVDMTTDPNVDDNINHQNDAHKFMPGLERIPAETVDYLVVGGGEAVLGYIRVFIDHDGSTMSAVAYYVG